MYLTKPQTMALLLSATAPLTAALSIPNKDVLSPRQANVWHIYAGSETDTGGMMYSAVWPVSAEPACDGGGGPTNAATLLRNAFNDVSQYGGWACDGCSGTGAGEWDITRFEMWDETNPDQHQYSITKTPVGYLTLYKQADGTYGMNSALHVGDVETPHGTCIRASPDSDDFDCKVPLRVTGGKHIFTCTSDLALNV